MHVQDVLPRDAIRSIDVPRLGPDYFGATTDEVIVVEGTPARAYPVRILSYHEIVNDVVDGEPIAVTWCPICWSGVAYRRMADGRELTFGVSGKLADDALVMYDRETESEWKQTTGRCISGELKGTRLTPITTVITTWEQFQDDHPGGVVLQPERGDRGPGQSTPDREYDMQPYERYVDRTAWGLYGMRGRGEQRDWDRDDLDPKTLVLGIEHDGTAVGYPRPRIVEAGGVVTDTVGGLDVVVFATDAGMFAYENPGYEFSVREGAFIADGTMWNAANGSSTDGRQLKRVTTRRLFAFAWQDDHGPDAFY